MTEFAWVDHYDAAAAAYEPPDVVQQYYTSNYTAPTWSDSTLASVFGTCVNDRGFSAILNNY